MSIKICIPQVYQTHTNKMAAVEVKGNTVGECFDDLLRQYPEIRSDIYTKDGKIASFIPLYVNGKYYFPLDLLRNVKDGDVLSIEFVHATDSG